MVAPAFPEHPISPVLIDAIGSNGSAEADGEVSEGGREGDSIVMSDPGDTGKCATILRILRVNSPFGMGDSPQ